MARMRQSLQSRNGAGGRDRSEVRKSLLSQETCETNLLRSRSLGLWPRGESAGLYGGHIGLAALGAFLCVCATAADGQDATWLQNPGSIYWNTGTNWTPAAVPTGTAIFGTSNTITLKFSEDTFIGKILLNDDANAYTFDIASNFLAIDGTGIVNNSSNSLTLSNSGPSGTFFENASTAGNTSTKINNISGGFTEFADTSSAGSALITNSGGGTTPAATFFVGASTADHSTIINADGGVTQFGGTSSEDGSDLCTGCTAGFASITNNGGTTFFLTTSNAGSATITTNSGGFTEFNDASSADHATVITNSGGVTAFQDGASGGQAQFITNAGGVFDISLLSSSGMTAGSIAGAGDYLLGSKTLTVGSNDLSTEVSGVIADGGFGGGVGGSLVKVGAGTLTLSGSNTYTGGTTISAGVLQIGDGGATGSIVGDVVDNAALAFDRSDNVTFGGVVSGTGSLSQLGAGTLTLTGANTYTGGTTISAGALQIGDGDATGSIVGDVVDNGALAFDRSDNVTFGGVISGTGSLSQLGAGTLTLTGANTYTGGTTISGGALQIGDGGATGSIVGNVVDNGALAFDRSDNVTFGGVISGTGSLSQLGVGTLTLTGANTYTGGTTISAGMLQIGDGGATGSIVGNVVDNGALAFDRSDNVTFGGVIGGTGSLSQLGAGTLTLTGANTYTGGTTISAGTLAGGATNTFSAASLTTINSGGTLDLGGFAQTINSVVLAGGAIANGQLTGAITSSGGTIDGISGGPSLTTNAGTTVLSGTNGLGAVTNGSTADLNVASGATTVSGLLTNSGSLTVAGGAALNVSGGGVADIVGGSIVATGTLNISTTNASAAALALQGDGASIVATGGGSILSAGAAIEFLGGNNQTATFDNFTIANLTGDLVFADASVATVNFNDTTANAGSGALLNATVGSSITLNANASTLTGAIQTDSTSTSTLNLTSGSTWTMTGSSTVSNLAATNSAIVFFSPPGSNGPFKTLTVNNYTGSNANITMNAALGTGSGDQIVINGGKATGQTLLTINNVGGSGASVPLVVTANGGTTNSNAFALAGANTLVVDGYSYTLQQSNQDWLLVAAPIPPQSDISNSVNSVAKAAQKQIITGRVLTSILLGATEQINCSNCSSGFGSVGSYAIGAHGRWALTDEVILMGGFSYDEYSADGITVSNAPIFAGSVVYDPINFGRSRPFVEIGGGVVPFEQVHYSRAYMNGLTPAVGEGTGVDRSLGLFGRIGWVDRVTPIDEAAVYADISRSWLSAGGYTEASSAVNPFPATVQTGIDTLNVARLGAQYTHLFNGQVRGQCQRGRGLWLRRRHRLAVGRLRLRPRRAFSDRQFDLVRMGRARRLSRSPTAWSSTPSLLGTAGGEVGTTFHGGIGLRYLF